MWVSRKWWEQEVLDFGGGKGEIIGVVSRRGGANRGEKNGTGSDYKTVIMEVSTKYQIKTIEVQSLVSLYWIFRAEITPPNNEHAIWTRGPVQKNNNNNNNKKYYALQWKICVICGQ